MIGGQFYLLPYGVARTEADLKASAISANEFHDEVTELAKHGRVLVLLDACHSGAITGDGSALTPLSNQERPGLGPALNFLIEYPLSTLCGNWAQGSR
jgi:hypothetical protein